MRDSITYILVPAFLLLLFIFAFVFMLLSIMDRQQHADCSEFESTSLKNVPARCFNYYGGTK